VENERQKWPGETARDELEILGTMDTTMIELMYRKDMHDLEMIESKDHDLSRYGLSFARDLARNDAA
jgi:hypothetical protein